MPKIEAFQDISERDVDISPITPPEEVTPVKAPVFKQETADRPLDLISKEPAAVPESPTNAPVFKQTITEQAPERLPSEPKVSVERVNIPVFKQDTPALSLNASGGGATVSGEERPTEGSQGSVFRGEVTEQPLKRGLV